MTTLRVYEAGVRSPDGKYAKFIESNERASVDDYIEIMKEAVQHDFEIVFLTKDYQLVSTTPHIISK